MTKDQVRKITTGKRRKHRSKIPSQSLLEWDKEDNNLEITPFPILNLKPVEVRGEQGEHKLNTDIPIEIHTLTPGKSLTQISGGIGG